MPSFVFARFAPAIIRASQRWSVSAGVLSAQLYAESNFNPFAVSPASLIGHVPVREMAGVRETKM